MLVYFSVQNYKTFREKVVLSLEASGYDTQTRVSENLHQELGFSLLKTAVIYGSNASGKSKLLEALGFMKRFVQESSKEGQHGQGISVEPFRLDVDTMTAPSEFEIAFTHQGVLYRYGFEVNQERVQAEWLYYRPKTKEVELFYREGQTFQVHTTQFTKAKLLVKEGLVRDNALLLSVAAQFNEPKAIALLEWFKKVKILSGLSDAGYMGYSARQLAELDRKAKMLQLLKAADLSIEDVQVQEVDPTQLPAHWTKEMVNRVLEELSSGNKINDIVTSHSLYQNGQTVGEVRFSLMGEESSGTRKYFAITGPILDVLENGHLLVVDELDAKLHPNLVQRVVELFNTPATNPQQAQLIFNTHDTNLLSAGLLRRDQIWFTEKNRFGQASLYSLADFKTDKVRKDEAYEENYLRGKYGAVPYLGFFDEINKIVGNNEK